MQQKSNLDRPGVISVLLALACVAAYLPAVHLGFVNFDDPLYLTDNLMVQKGLTWTSTHWAFTHFHSANWHPLTWLSHMLDVQLYGLQPFGHHLTNFVLHTANAVLLFLWLRSLTGACWRSAFVAALFALHPLHVESVAWISERKDVLSAFFGILSLWAYTRYARESKMQLYLLALLLFALGLMSKPMLVTWPCVMLLLDYWPLGRTPWRKEATSNIATRSGPMLVAEKLPFFLLSAAASYVTFHAQKSGRAMVSLQSLSIDQRLTNTPVAYLRYLGKTIWPANLAVIYPLSDASMVMVVLALLVLAGITLFAILQRDQRPYLLTGWFWFLGTLVPVIGLVQVGNQSMADRYTYLPSIGFFIALVWFVAEMAKPSPTLRRAVAIAGGAALIACAFVTFRQLSHWQNSETLFRHALAVTKNNSIAWINLGSTLADHHDYAEAERCYRMGAQITPNYAEGWYNLGCMLGEQNRNEEAVVAYETALRFNPNHFKLRNNLAAVLAATGNKDEAEIHLRAAIEIDPAAAESHDNLANLLAQQGKWDDAIAEFKKAIALNPAMPDPRLGLAGAFAKAGRYDEAVTELSSLARSSPTNVAARLQLAGTFAMQGKTDIALKEYADVLQANPNDATAHSRLASLQMRTGNIKDAIAHYRAAIAARPEFADAMNNLAWTLATNPNAEFRDGPEAVSLAERACQLTNYQQAFMIGTLAAAYAEAGRFPDAISTAGKAQELAAKSNDPELAAKNGKLLELYRAGKAYRDDGR